MDKKIAPQIYQQILDLNPNPILLINRNLDLVYANEAYQSIYGDDLNKPGTYSSSCGLLIQCSNKSKNKLENTACINCAFNKTLVQCIMRMEDSPEVEYVFEHKKEKKSSLLRISFQCRIVRNSPDVMLAVFMKTLDQTNIEE